MLTYGIPPDFRGGVHLFILNNHTPLGQSRVYQVTQLRTDGVHCRESAGTKPVVVRVVPVTDAAFAGHHGPINVRLSFSTPTIGMATYKLPGTKYNIINTTNSQENNVKKKKDEQQKQHLD